MTLAEYLLRFSISVSVTWLFYRLLLSQLTFYNWNRFYLVGYALMCFVIPFLDVTGWLKEEQLPATVASGIPVIDSLQMQYSPGEIWQDVFLFVVIAGAMIALVRLMVRYVAFRGVKQNSVLLHREGAIKVYGSSEMQGAFSFGNEIYINHSEHSGEELKRILLHEIVHVKQKHTVDLIVGELICIFNWYNPFAWLLRKSIRQNLEFIADANVISGGADAKEYQYLLLKVTGVRGYNIASHFNISDLKKRIIMINKLKSAKLHLLRFLFAIPLLAVVLLAFRSEQKLPDTILATTIKTDTVPDAAKESPVKEQESQHIVSEGYNAKGYALSVITANGESVVLISQRGSKGVTAMTLKQWNENRAVNEQKYGKLPPPPAPVPAPPVPPAPAAEATPAPQPVPAVAPEPPVPPAAPKKPKNKSRSAITSVEREELVEAQIKMEEKQQQLQEAQVKLQERANQLKLKVEVIHQQELEHAKIRLNQVERQVEQHEKQKRFMGIPDTNEAEK